MQGKRSEEIILRDSQGRPSRKGPNKATREPKRERERERVRHQALCVVDNTATISTYRPHQFNFDPEQNTQQDYP